MKSSKTFNNLSDKFKSKIPKLKPGESVVFQMLNGVPNPEPDEKQRAREGEVLYPKVQLMTQFRVYDEWQQDATGKEVGGFVDVGCVDAWLGDNPTRYRSFVAGVATGGAITASRFQGKFELKGGNVQDEELYEIFYISPQREGSPCFDSSVELMFKIKDINSENKSSLNRYDTLKKALDIVKEIKSQKAKEVMAALGQPTYQDESVLMAKIKDLASSKPDDFIKTFESAETPIRSLLKDAMDSGVLTHDIATGAVKLGDVKILDLKVDDIALFLPQLTSWINTAANGQEVLTNIKSRMGKSAAK